MRKLLIACALGGLVASTVHATPPPPIVPRPPTGFSTIEQRYVYAQPDEGSFEFDIQLGAAPGEMAIQTPDMCNSPASHIKYTYSKSNNTVVLEAWLRGLPYRPTFYRDHDHSTPWNQFPTEVHDARYQVWIMSNIAQIPELFYYDGTTLDLLGDYHSFPDGQPAGSIPVVIPGTHILCSPEFDAKKPDDDHGHHHGDDDDNTTYERFTYRYDQLLDADGTGGTIITYVPKNLLRPDEYTPIYTNGGLDPSEALNFDDFLSAINAGYNIGIATSLEPEVKPAYLKARDNLMIPHIGLYPQTVPEGYYIDLQKGTYQRRTSCETHEEPPFEAAYYNFGP